MEVGFERPDDIEHTSVCWLDTRIQDSDSHRSIEALDQITEQEWIRGEQMHPKRHRVPSPVHGMNAKLVLVSQLYGRVSRWLQMGLSRRRVVEASGYESQL